VEPLSTSHLVSLESARTFVPGWWLHAFEASLSGARDDCYFGVEAGTLLPKFDSSELGLLSLLLGDIQRQLLMDDSSHSAVELEWSCVLKLLSGVDVTSKERLFRVFEALPQIRFVVRKSDGSLSSLPLFVGEQWIIGEGASRATRLKLKPGPFTIELLTGYVDGHMDFIRKISGKGRISDASASRSPLVLWTPVWLELSVAEQIVYARMEAAMQAHGAWLRLDGLVGVPLDKITEGVKLPKKSGDAISPLKDKLRLVGKLGRRLIAHGVIKKEPDSGYMALDGKKSDASPLLLWQASAERLKSRAECEYFGLASARILRGITISDAALIRSIFAALSGDSQRTMPHLFKVWCEIKDIPGCGIRLAPDVMIQSHFLFMEWIARVCPGTLLPLPGFVGKHPVARYCEKTEDCDIVRRFHDFVRALSKADDLASSMVNIHDSKDIFSVALGTVSESIIKICEQVAISSGNQENGIIASLKVKGQQISNKGSSALPLNRISVNKESVLAEKQDFAAQKLRRIAQDELEKMMRQAPDAYRSLKAKYIASLPSETREMVMDVQRRLGSSDFDRHLKVRLVRYMIDEPSSWNSVSFALPV
jgi:hypothetical protein